MAKRREYEPVGSSRRQKEHQTGFSPTSFKVPDGTELFSVKKEGVYELDIIPYIAGVGNPFADEGAVHQERTYYTHPRIGVNEDSFVCLTKTYGKRCPICEEHGRQKKNPEADKKLVKSLFWKERQLWNVIDVNDDSEKIKLWEISYHLFGKLLDSRIEKSNPKRKWGFYADIKMGFTLSVTFIEKKNEGFTWYEANAIDFDPREEEYDASIIEEAACLDDLLIETAYKRLSAVFNQTEDSDDEEPQGSVSREVEGDDEPPPRRRRRKAAEPVDDDSDGKGWEDNDDPPPDDEPPKRRRRAAPVDDDPEPEPPRRRRRTPVDDDPADPAPDGQDWDDPDPADGDDLNPDDPSGDDPEPAPRRRKRKAAKRKAS